MLLALDVMTTDLCFSLVIFFKHVLCAPTTWQMLRASEQRRYPKDAEKHSRKVKTHIKVRGRHSQDKKRRAEPPLELELDEGLDAGCIQTNVLIISQIHLL